ncbi:MAG TPA: hypothetical protein VFJ18_12150, partial [Pararhizobium sp.]|nr:hypothetical protein [Pararhizobium sp.]
MSERKEAVRADEPFCYVAEKKGRCFGVTAGDFEVERFYRDFAGYTIRPIPTRDHWDIYRKAMLFGRDK